MSLEALGGPNCPGPDIDQTYRSEASGIRSLTAATCAAARRNLAVSARRAATLLCLRSSSVDALATSRQCS